jgi:hypothetical protein
MDMDPAQVAALRAVDEAERLRRPPAPLTLREDYLEAVARAEALSDNQSGSDKTWVFALLERSRRLWAGARRVR